MYFIFYKNLLRSFYAIFFTDSQLARKSIFSDLWLVNSLFELSNVGSLDYTTQRNLELEF